jgi:hypothetical protein
MMDAGGKSREETPKEGTAAPGMDAGVTELGTFRPQQSSLAIGCTGTRPNQVLLHQKATNAGPAAMRIIHRWP